MDESQDHYAECEKPDTKKYIRYDGIYLFLFIKVTISLLKLPFMSNEYAAKI